MAMSGSAVARGETLGLSVPPLTPHAISVSLPAWNDNVGLRTGERRVLYSLRAGYPRLWLYPIIRRLTQVYERKFARDGEECLLFPSKKIVDECQTFILRRAVLAGTPTSVRIVHYTICPEDSAAQTGQYAELHMAFFPANIMSIAMEFWVDAGLGISSRFAELCFTLLPREDQQILESLGECQHVALPSNRMAKSNGTYVEEGSERNSACSAGEFAKRALRRRIAKLVVTGKDLDGPQEPCAGAQIKIGLQNGDVHDVSEDDVFLFPTGMAAVWNAHQLCLRARPAAKSVCFGFPYVDTLKVLQKWGPGAHFFGHGLDSDVDALERLLAEESSRDPTKPPILALIAEVPSNPLLRSVDIHRLRALADTYDFLLIIDDTIGNFVNVEVLPHADIVVTSLTKIFSGAANVMGGSLVLNPKGRHYATLKSHMDVYEDTYFDEDAVVMERNSRDLVQRVRIIDENAEAVCAFLRTRSAAEGAPSAVVKQVFYPKYITPTHYLRCKRPEGGYGGLLSLTFTSLAASTAFYDALDCHKGPSLGTNFTLASPYTTLAFHGETEWAAQYGIEEKLVRISVGMEDRDLLIRIVDTALKAAESAQ